MARADWKRSGALSLILSMTAMGVACSTQEHVTTPTIPSPVPTPAPTPAPTPVPSPTPQASQSGIFVDVFQFPKESKCKRGVHPTGTEDLRVDCSIEVRVELKDANGDTVPERQTGNNLEWHIRQGKSSITLPWDENPWKRWMTGIAPGPYRIEVTIHLRHGDQATGLLSGQIVP